jgi:hypothetical protein
MMVSVLCFHAWCMSPALADTFPFGNNVNGLNAAPGPPSKTFIGSDFTMRLSAGPAGAVLRETGGSAGLGVDSSPLLPTTTDLLAFSMSLLGGSSALAGSSEFVEFSFDQPGVLTGINFDGLSDERLEFFRLETTGGVRYNFFDSAANTTVPGAVEGAALPGTEIYLLEILGGPNDEAQELAIPFTAGQVFTLTYDELGAEHGALIAGNGASLQGITVAAVPEPAAIFTVIQGGLAVVACLRHRRSVVSS